MNTPTGSLSTDPATMNQSLAAEVSNDLVPPRDVIACPTPREPTAAVNLVSLAPAEQVEVLLAHYHGAYGGLSKTQMYAVLQALAEYDRKQTRAADETAVALLWEKPEGRKILDYVICGHVGHAHGLDPNPAAPDGHGRDLVRGRLVQKGYNGVKDLIVPSPAAEMKAFIIWAIRAVFKVKIQDLLLRGWQVKHLRRMWCAFSTPVRENFVKGIEKTRLTWSPESTYGNTNKKIKMSAWLFGHKYGEDRTSKLMAFVRGLSKDAIHYVRTDNTSADDKDAFYGTALHEIGHAVDNKLRVMGLHGNMDVCGGWGSYESEEEVIKKILVLLDDMAQRSEFGEGQQALRRDIRELERSKVSAERELSRLRRLQSSDEGLIAAATERVDAATAALNEKLQGEKPVDDVFESVHTVTKELMESVLKRLFENKSIESMADLDVRQQAFFRQHRAVRLIQAACLKIGRWERPMDQFKGLTLCGQVFHKAYDGRWASYILDAKRDRVTEYQFRAQGEWFADFYAFYHMGLTGDHPLHRWMAVVATTEEGPVPNPTSFWPESLPRYSVADGPGVLPVRGGSGGDGV